MTPSGRKPRPKQRVGTEQQTSFVCIDEPNLQWIPAIEVDIALRKRDRDSVFGEQFGNPEANLAANLAKKLLAANVAPEIRIKYQCTIAEVFKYDRRRRLLLDLWLRSDSFQNQVSHFAYG